MGEEFVGKLGSLDGLLATEKVRKTLAVHFMPNLHLLQVYQSWKLIAEGGKPFLLMIAASVASTSMQLVFAK